MYNNRKNITSVEYTPGLFFKSLNTLHRGLVIDKKIKPVWEIVQIHKASITDVVFTGENARKKPHDARNSEDKPFHSQAFFS
jgi:hypothetical protein